WELPGGKRWANRFRTAGKWRLEISDSEQKNSTIFLNILQASESSTSSQINKSLKQTEQHDIVSITDEKGNRWELSFNKVGTIGLHIKMKDRKGKVQHDKYLDNEIETKR